MVRDISTGGNGNVRSHIDNFKLSAATQVNYVIKFVLDDVKNFITFHQL